MKKLRLFASLLLSTLLFTLLLSIQTEPVKAWPIIEWDPKAINCYKSGIIVSFGAECVIGYNMCIANPCPEGSSPDPEE